MNGFVIRETVATVFLLFAGAGVILMALKYC